MTNYERIIEPTNGKLALAEMLAGCDEFDDKVISPWWCNKQHGKCPMRNECSDNRCLCDWNEFNQTRLILIWLDDKYREH